MLQQLRDEQLSIPDSDALLAKPWTVFSKACFCKPQTVLRYLGKVKRKTEVKVVATEPQTLCWHCPHCQVGLLHLASVLAQRPPGNPDG